MYEQHKQGRLRVLAVTDRERSTIAPEIPTSGEAGYPDLVATSVFVLLVPANPPAPIVGTLDGAMRRVLTSAEFQADLRAFTVEQVKDIGPEAAKRFIEILASYNVPATIRVRRGIDIDAGCGQLKAAVTRGRKTVKIEDIA